MEIVITEWALDSYLDLLSRNAFTREEYKKTIRPDVRCLHSYPKDPKFKSGKFWSPASNPRGGRSIQNGYKMKWHNLGPGKVQLRLPIGILRQAVLCEAYVKENARQEKRKLARFKTHLQLVMMGKYTERGRLP